MTIQAVRLEVLMVNHAEITVFWDMEVGRLVPMFQSSETVDSLPNYTP
jgi:hypothetical protein